MKLSRIIAPLKLDIEVEDLIVSDIVYDSRKAKENCIFVCLRGHSVDGHKYAMQAYENGASVIIAEEPVDVPCQLILVEDTRKALALISAAFFKNPAKNDIKVIGITGTKGKTTTTAMVQSILESAGYRTGTIGTLGVSMGRKMETIKTENTTPESYEIQKYLRKMADEGCRYCVIEASSIGLKDYRIYGFMFEVGIFTNFSEDHIGGDEHKDMEEYLQSKNMLFKMCKTGVINIDDPSWQKIVEGHTCELKTYGFSEKAQTRGADYKLLTKGGFLGISLRVQGKWKFTAEIGIPGRFNAYNALASIACCNKLGITAGDMNRGLRRVKVKGRVERVSVPGNYTLLIDYAHNAVSMESLLHMLREYNPNRLICMFGAGGNRPKVRRYEMGEVSGRLADLSVITEDNSRFEDVNDIIADIKTGMAKTNGAYVEIPDRREAIRYCIKNAQDGDIIVLAGKGHEDYQDRMGEKIPFDERVIINEILEEDNVGNIE